jgi:hypothetical protein
LCSGESTSGRGRVNGDGKKRQLWLKYFPYMYEYGTSKPVQVILRRGEEEGE